MKPPDKGNFIKLPCVRCRGADLKPPCEFCGGWGFTRLEECPQQGMLEDIMPTIKAADFARKGMWPEDGGMNSQCESFAEAADFFWNEVDRHKAKLGIPIPD